MTPDVSTSVSTGQAAGERYRELIERRKRLCAEEVGLKSRLSEIDIELDAIRLRMEELEAALQREGEE